MEMTNTEISQQVRLRVKDRHGTNLACCSAFNVRYAREIETNLTRSLNKDFLSRVERNDFKVLTKRILKLCEFLEIREVRSTRYALVELSDQIKDFREKSRQDVEFGHRFSAVERFLSGLNLEKFINEA